MARPRRDGDDGMPESNTPLICQDCGGEYLVTPGEAAWFSQRRWELPRRCKPCRDARKQRAHEQAGGLA
jgi:Probable zinc-ribbon domain